MYYPAGTIPKYGSIRKRVQPAPSRATDLKRFCSSPDTLHRGRLPSPARLPARPSPQRPRVKRVVCSPDAAMHSVNAVPVPIALFCLLTHFVPSPRRPLLLASERLVRRPLLSTSVSPRSASLRPRVARSHRLPRAHPTLVWHPATDRQRLPHGCIEWRRACS